MTSVECTIGGHVVSGDVLRVEYTMEIGAVGTFSITLDNTDGKYSGTFSVQDIVDVNLGGANLFNGWVDSVEPAVTQEPDVATQVLVVRGRDYGRELTDRFVDKYYEEQPADDLIEQALTDAGSNIDFTSPSAGTTVSYRAEGQYLLNLIRDIAERDGADWYVDSTASPYPELDYFQRGSKSSGVTLQTGLNGNVLEVDRTEEIGADIKNYIYVRGGKVEDGWTELNASDWNHPTDSTVADDTSSATAGIASIKFTKSLASASWVELDFTGGLYGRTSIDLSQTTGGELSFDYAASTVIGYSGVTVYLTDTAGNVIQSKKFINLLAAGDWVKIVLPVGADTRVLRLPGPAAPAGSWRYYSGSTFNWNIAKIKIESNENYSFWVDNLSLPARMFSVAQDAASQASYGVRKLAVTKTNIPSQVELNRYAESILLQRKNPVSTIRLLCKGTAGIVGFNNKWRPGYIFTLNIPEESISSESYRATKITHIWTDDSPPYGYHYTVNIELIEATDEADQKRLDRLKNELAIIQELRETLRDLEQTEEPEVAGYPPLPGPVEDYYLISNRQWRQSWDVETSPTTIDPSVDSAVSAGSSTVSDVQAVGQVAVKRPSTASSGYMFGSEVIYPPVSGMFSVGVAMKVSDNTSTATVFELEITSVEGYGSGSTQSVFTVTPSDFDYSDVYCFFWGRLYLRADTGYRFRGKFTSGITDVYVDWVGVTDAPVPYATAGIAVAATATGLENLDSSTNLDNLNTATNLDNLNTATNLSNVNSATGLTVDPVSAHLHDLSNIAGYVVKSYGIKYALDSSVASDRYALDLGGSTTLYAFTSNSTSSALQAFKAIPISTNIVKFKAIATATNIVSFYAPETISSATNVATGTATLTSGAHNHSTSNDSHNHPHGTDSHNHPHGTDSHNHPHGTDSHGHAHGEDSHTHPSEEPSEGHKH